MKRLILIHLFMCLRKPSHFFLIVIRCTLDSLYIHHQCQSNNTTLQRNEKFYLVPKKIFFSQIFSHLHQIGVVVKNFFSLLRFFYGFRYKHTVTNSSFTSEDVAAEDHVFLSFYKKLVIKHSKKRKLCFSLQHKIY